MAGCGGMLDDCPMLISPKGPKYLHGTKYGFCSSNFPYGLGKYSLYWYLGPFGFIIIKAVKVFTELQRPTK